MNQPLDSEVNERIRSALPEGWEAPDGELISVTGMNSGPPHRWHVVFSRVFLLEDPGASMGQLEVDVLGHSLEDVLVVARRLDAIGEAIAFPWSIAITVEGDAVRTV